MPRRRTLHPEEAELWQAVARSARPLKAQALAKAAPPRPIQNLPAAIDEPLAPPLSPFRMGEKATISRPHDLSPPLSKRIGEAPLRMDAKAFGRMTRGKLAPEARIDLHGMTLAEAHPALIGFILRAQSQGLRLVLVITGKGKPAVDDGPIPRRLGVLRHQTPQWLRQPPLSPHVLQIAEAHARHGGGGAFYVYLRR
jgi:DNA-nicking Smr family endonuclease